MEHPHYALVMQYYADGTLLQLLQRDSLALSWERRYTLAHDIAQGMRYLHSRPVEAIVHGDLKSSNLLMDAEGRVRPRGGSEGGEGQHGHAPERHVGLRRRGCCTYRLHMD
jgi:serine/threonine protein kinase